MEKELKDFMNSAANLGIKDEDFSAVTVDGKTYDGVRFRALMLVLADCSEDTLDSVGALDFFKSITKTFVRANLEETLQRFIQHHVALKFARLVETKGREL